MGRRWREAFEAVPVDILRRRPDVNVWSPLEYAAHTRDVLTLLGGGLNEVLDGERPEYPATEPEADAPDHGYNDLDPERVLASLEKRAVAIAVRAAKAVPDHWSRTGSLGGEAVDAGWILRHAVHDASHHLKDIDRILSSAR